MFRGNLLLGVLAFYCIAVNVSADTTSMAEPKGFIYGAEISSSTRLGTILSGVTGINSVIKYWSDYAGVILSIGYDKIQLGSTKTDSAWRMASIQGEPGILVGTSYGVLKPHIDIRSSFQYWSFDDIGIFIIAIQPSVALDILASDHIVLGFRLFTFSYALYGDFEQKGASEKTVSSYNDRIESWEAYHFFNSVSVSYKF